MTIPVPNFSSDQLRQAVTQAQSVIETIDEARNAMSEDIKRLENYLQEIDLNVPFSFSLGMSFLGHEDMSDQQIKAALDDHGAISAWIEQENLVWDMDRQCGKFRLIYEHRQWDGGVDVDAPGGPLFWDEKTLQRDLRPLIETKFEVRKRMYEHLPEFVKALTSHCRIGNESSETPPDDIPF